MGGTEERRLDIVRTVSLNESIQLSLTRPSSKICYSVITSVNASKPRLLLVEVTLTHGIRMDLASSLQSLRQRNRTAPVRQMGHDNAKALRIHPTR